MITEYVARDMVMEQMILNDAMKRRVITLNTEIDRDSIYKAKYLLEKIIRADVNNGFSPSKTPIIIRLDSYGGEVTSTMHFISQMGDLQKQGWIINTEALGVCMSGAFKVLLAGNERSAYKYCDLMAHQPNVFVRDTMTFKDFKIDYEGMKRTWVMLKKYIISRCKITEEQLDAYVHENRDWHMTAEEAYELGVITKIIG